MVCPGQAPRVCYSPLINCAVVIHYFFLTKINPTISVSNQHAHGWMGGERVCVKKKKKAMPSYGGPPGKSLQDGNQHASSGMDGGACRGGVVASVRALVLHSALQSSTCRTLQHFIVKGAHNFQVCTVRSWSSLHQKLLGVF